MTTPDFFAQFFRDGWEVRCAVTRAAPGGNLSGRAEIVLVCDDAGNYTVLRRRTPTRRVVSKARQNRHHNGNKPGRTAVNVFRSCQWCLCQVAGQSPRQSCHCSR